MSPAYDPKARRAHSPTDAEGPAPVDGLLGAATDEPAPTPAVSEPAEPAPAPADPTAEPAAAGPVMVGGRPHAPAPAPTNPGPDPRLFAVVAAVVAAVMIWRWRRTR